MTCLDSPYRQYVLGMMDEIFSRYEIEELFLDIFGIQFARYNDTGMDPFCYCKYTEEAWNKEHPDDPYRDGFKTREGWERRYRWHQKRTMTDMLDEVIATALKHRPKALISLNGGPENFPDDVHAGVSFIYAEPITTRTGISIGSILRARMGTAELPGRNIFTPRVISTPSRARTKGSDRYPDCAERTNFLCGERTDHQRSRRAGILQALVRGGEGELGGR